MIDNAIQARDAAESLFAEPVDVRIGVSAETAKTITVKPLPVKSARHLLARAARLFQEIGDADEHSDGDELMDDAFIQGIINKHFDSVIGLVASAINESVELINDSATAAQLIRLVRAVVEVNEIQEVIEGFFGMMKQLLPRSATTPHSSYLEQSEVMPEPSKAPSSESTTLDTTL